MPKSIFEQLSELKRIIAIDFMKASLIKFSQNAVTLDLDEDTTQLLHTLIALDIAEAVHLIKSRQKDGVLALESAALNDSTLELLCSLLQLNKTSLELTTLNLSGNTITSQSMQYLTNLLQYQTTIQILLLDSNNLDYNCAKDIALILKRNAPIHLALNNNPLGDLGLTMILMRLVTHPVPLSIPKLELRNTNITEIGARCLAETMTSGNLPANLNWTIDISNNSLTPAGTECLLDAMSSDKRPAALKLIINGPTLSSVIPSNSPSTPAVRIQPRIYRNRRRAGKPTIIQNPAPRTNLYDIFIKVLTQNTTGPATPPTITITPPAH